jgi:hypothetical protein
LILVIARSLARSLAFAGSTLSVQREMSAGTSGLKKHQLSIFIKV